MRFDRTAPGQGLMVSSRIENGKAYLKFSFAWQSGETDPAQENRSKEAKRVVHRIRIQLWDPCGQQVFFCTYPVEEEEPARALLLHPHLWNGVEDPYQYRIQATLEEKSTTDGKDEWVREVDKLEQKLALYTLQELPGKGWQLNGKSFPVHAVAYPLPPQIAEGVSRRKRMEEDLELLTRMGANVLHLLQGDGGEGDALFCRLCAEKGLLTDEKLFSGEELPVWQGTADSILISGTHTLTDRYYALQARFTRQPMVYLAVSTLKKQENGSFSILAYSNQKKVALYVDGILFEFHTGGPDFLFEELPARHYPLVLTAEAGGASCSVTVYDCR